MAELRFTPGPWVVNKDRRGAGKLYVREAKLSEVAGATAGRAVAQVTAVVGSDEQLANALLMAAAPTLHLSLIGIVALLEDPKTGDVGRVGALNLARSALSKAEGVDP